MKKTIIISLLCCISFVLQADWEITVENKTDESIALSNAPSLGTGVNGVIIRPFFTEWFRVKAGSSRELLIINGQGQGSVKITNGYPVYTARISSVSANIASLNASIVIPYTLNPYSSKKVAGIQAKKSQATAPWEAELKTPAEKWAIKVEVVIPLHR